MKLARLLPYMAVILIAFFSLRGLVCEYRFPEMRTVAQEWDGANNLTMDTFAWMFLICFAMCRILAQDIKLKLLLDILIGFSASDVIDRFFGKRYTDHTDLYVAIFTILLILIDYYRQIKKRL